MDFTEDADTIGSKEMIIFLGPFYLILKEDTSTKTIIAIGCKYKKEVN